MFHISTETFKAICFAYFHSIIKCGRIEGLVGGGGNSSYSKNIVSPQTKIVCILMGAKPADSYKVCFKHVTV
jgi:hypothetical protein